MKSSIHGEIRTSALSCFQTEEDEEEEEKEPGFEGARSRFNRPFPS